MQRILAALVIGIFVGRASDCAHQAILTKPVVKAPPKLVVVLVIDQFRADFLMRFKILKISTKNHRNCRYNIYKRFGGIKKRNED